MSGAGNYPLEESQLKAAQFSGNHGVVMAGAGSGKTTVMAARVVYAVSDMGLAPDRILGLTFTNFAAGELAAKVRDSLGSWRGEKSDIAQSDSDDLPQISTYHSFAAAIYRDHAVRIGIEPDLLPITDGRRHQLAARVVRRAAINEAEIALSFKSVIEAIVQLDQRLANYDVEVAAAMQEDQRVLQGMLEAFGKFGSIGIGRGMVDSIRARLQLWPLVDAYRQERLAAGFMDYSDMQRYALAIARLSSDVVKEVRERFDLVLLDEYQDTSVTQRRLMQALFADKVPVTAVGDPLQCIYGFQGANPMNIVDFAEHFKLADKKAEHFPLPITYRNGPVIVDLANTITKSIRDRFGAPAMIAAPEPEHGKGEVLVAGFEEDTEEADWIAGHLREQHEQGVAYEKMALLLRQGADAAWFAQQLNDRGIPAQLRGKRTVVQVPVIAELMALLRIVAEPAANVAWLRVLSGSRWRLCPRDLRALARIAKQISGKRDGRGESFEEALQSAVDSQDTVDLVAYGDAVEAVAGGRRGDLSEDAVERIKSLVAEVSELRSHVSEPLSDFVFRVARTTGLLNEASSHGERVSRGMNVNLRSAMALAGEFVSAEGEAGLFSFLDWIDFSDRFKKAHAEFDAPIIPGAVQVMTAHAAKGLQYEVVALPRLAYNKFPSGNSDSHWPYAKDDVPLSLVDDASLSEFLKTYPPLDRKLDTPTDKKFKDEFRERAAIEELRLFYVAVTRTRRLLLASTAVNQQVEEACRPPSEYWWLLVDYVESLGQKADMPDSFIAMRGATGPMLKRPLAPGVWPVPLDSPEMQSMRELANLVQRMLDGEEIPGADAALPEVDAAIDAIEREFAERAQTEHLLPLPASISVSNLLYLAKDEQGFLDELLRPMPRAPMVAAARGTAFHEWVERRSRKLMGPGVQESLLDEQEAERDYYDPLDPVKLAEFKQTFRDSEWGQREPAFVELPFSLVVGGRVLKGRIDAVYRDEATGVWQVIDWKTNEKPSADPLQLSVYAHALAKLQQCDVSQVRSGFYYVALDLTAWEDDLLSLEEIERMLNG